MQVGIQNPVHLYSFGPFAAACRMSHTHSHLLSRYPRICSARSQITVSWDSSLLRTSFAYHPPTRLLRETPPIAVRCFLLTFRCPNLLSICVGCALPPLSEARSFLVHSSDVEFRIRLQRSHCMIDFKTAIAS